MSDAARPGPLQRARARTRGHERAAPARPRSRSRVRRPPRGYGPAPRACSAPPIAAAAPAGAPDGPRVRARGLLRRGPPARGDRGLPAGCGGRGGRHRALPRDARRARGAGGHGGADGLVRAVAHVGADGRPASTTSSATCSTWRRWSPRPRCSPSAGRRPCCSPGSPPPPLYGLSERLLPGLVRARALGRGRRPARPAADVLERPGRAGGDRARAGGRLAGRPRACAASRLGPRPRPLLGLDLYLTLSRGAVGALVAGLLVLVALRPHAGGAARACSWSPWRLRSRPCSRRPCSTASCAPMPSAGAGAAMLVARPCRDRARRRALIPLPAVARRSPWLRPLAVAGARRGARGHGRRSRRPGDAVNRLRAARLGREQPLRLLARGGRDVRRAPAARHRQRAASASNGCCAASREESCATPTRSTWRRRPSSASWASLALGALFGGVAAAARRARLPAATAALATWAVHAGLDWDWEMPALTLVAVLLARRRDRGRGAGGRHGRDPARSSGRSHAYQLAAATATVSASASAAAVRNGCQVQRAQDAGALERDDHRHVPQVDAVGDRAEEDRPAGWPARGRPRRGPGVADTAAATRPAPTAAYSRWRPRNCQRVYGSNSA